MENEHQDLINKFGKTYLYLHELVKDTGVLFFSEELLPASKKEIEESAMIFSLLSKDDNCFISAKELLNFFIPHDDALELVVSWNNVKNKLEGKKYDIEAEKKYMKIIEKYIKN